MMVCLVGFDYDVVDVVLLQSALGYGCFFRFAVDLFR